MQEVDFPHTATAVAPDSPQGTRWVSRVPYANFYLFGALGKNNPLGRRRRRRDEGHGEPVSSYAAWSDSPALLPIVEEHPVWRAALDELAAVMTPENFNAWLASTRALDQHGEVLRVAVPAAFNQTWLEQKLAGKVMAALHKIDYDGLGAGRIERVEYVVEVAA